MNIFVGCSSRNEIDEKYMILAKDLGIALSERGHDLVFGACDNSSMGAIYRIMNEYGRKITGIIAEAYIDDLKKLDIPEENIIKTKTCTDRNMVLIQISDAILFLEGGIGTYQEILTSIEAKRSGEFDKPIVIINKFGYFDNLIMALESAYKEGFTGANTKDTYYFTNNIEDALNYIENHKYSNKQVAGNSLVS